MSFQNQDPREKTIVNVDSTLFRLWCLKKFDVELNKKNLEESNNLRSDTKRFGHLKAKLAGAAKA